MRPILGLLALTACGGASFQGTWRGQLSAGGTCSDGTWGASDRTIVWVIMENAGELSVTPEGGTCGVLTATVEGQNAKLVRKECPPTNPLIAAGFERGTLTLHNQGTLLVSFTQFFATASETCASTASGSLLREH